MPSKKVVLIFDAAQRSALAATRSLGRREDITVYTTDSTPQALAGQSKYSSGYLPSPNPATDTGAFIDWLEQIITAYHIDVLLPVTEISSRTLVENKDRLSACKLPFSDLSTLLSLSDKNALTRLAEEVGVPVPASQFCSDASEVDWQAVKFPCVLKPSLSRVLEGNTWLSTQVHIVANKDEMQLLLNEKPYFKAHPFMVQQYIDGHGAGVFCYYQHGQAKAFFAHQRLREKPPSGGVSVLSQSVPVDPVMQQHAQALLDYVNWHGVAMVEFRVARDGTPYLMEINTRLWGSLQLAIDAGVNFPALLVDGEYETLSNMQSFRHYVQLRWVLGDVDNLYLQLKDKNLSVGNKIKACLTFITPKWKNRRHEINRMDDMGPFWYELKHYF